jgi:hypothetical protein
MERHLLLGSAIATISIASRAGSQANDVYLVANVQRDGDGCRITVDGKQVTSDALLQLVGAGKYHRGIVVSRRDVTYKCIGEACICFNVQVCRRSTFHLDCGLTSGSERFLSRSAMASRDGLRARNICLGVCVISLPSYESLPSIREKC